MRLKKIRGEKFVEKEEEVKSQVIEFKPMSIKERLAMFEAASKGDN